MKKNQKISRKFLAIGSFLTLFLFTFFNSCNKTRTLEEELIRLQSDYNVKLNKDILKIQSNDKTQNFQSIEELEKNIKSDKYVKNSRIYIAKKKDNNVRKIADYVYDGNEFGAGGGGNTELYAGEFQYANPLGTMYTIHTTYIFNSTTGQFSNFGVNVTGLTGQYSATLNNTTSSNYGSYHRIYHYYVTITRVILVQGFPLTYSYNKHYTLTVNRYTGLLVGVNEIQ